MLIGAKICANHFPDQYVKSFIIESGDTCICEYCPSNTTCVSTWDLARFIEDCIVSEYDNPDNLEYLYNAELGKYYSVYSQLKVYNTTELLEELLPDVDFEILEDISNHFSNNFWASNDSIWGPSQTTFLKNGWEKFKNIIKHKVRFLFFDDTFKYTFHDEADEALNPYLILKELGEGIQKLNLFTAFDGGQLQVFRCRQHNNEEPVNNAFALGSSPSSKAKANRMSPVGISMFYGALDLYTCNDEVLDVNWHNTILTTGCFTNLKALNLIDFTKIKNTHSIFDAANSDNRVLITFIQEFTKDLSIPIKPDDKTHIDYIPTQIGTEYLRYFLNPIHGIIYNSVKGHGGKCVVLFIENDQITDNIKAQPLSKVSLLELDNKSIVNKNIN
ncbi:MAG: HEPN-associated N-terminal domain-containing protein [Bacteroidia bacterium]